MTILVGVLCDDGIIVGADSSATFGVAGIRTVEQPTRKISIFHGGVVVAGTGQVGLNQRFCQIVNRVFADAGFQQLSPIDKAKQLTVAARMDFQSTGAPIQGQYGALLAFHQDNKYHLIEFASDTFQPEMKEGKSWFVSMGSGQLIADPFMGLMRRAFSPDGPPKMPTGLFIAAWTLHHTCDVNPGGVKEPIDLAILSNSQGVAKAELLEETMVEEHLGNVQAAYIHLADYAKKLQPGQPGEGLEAPAIPEPPAPPPVGADAAPPPA